MSSNDLLCSILWHVTCMVRHRSDCDTGTFYLPLDLRQMHAPDAYFGNAQCVQTVVGESSVSLYLCSAHFVGSGQCQWTVSVDSMWVHFPDNQHALNACDSNTQNPATVQV